MKRYILAGAAMLAAVGAAAAQPAPQFGPSRPDITLPAYRGGGPFDTVVRPPYVVRRGDFPTVAPDRPQFGAYKPEQNLPDHLRGVGGSGWSDTAAGWNDTEFGINR